MLHLEIAVAPSEIHTLQDLALLEARLGFDKGTVLSSFPKAWFRDVAERLKAINNGVGREKLIERLRRFKEGKVVAFNRQYSGDTWADAARASHDNESFHRLVEESFNELPVYVHALTDLDDDDFEFVTHYRRHAEDLADAAKALLIGAEKVTIYDPYICLTKNGYKKTLLAMMDLCCKAEVEFHIFSEEDGKRDWVLRQTALDAFKAEMPENIRLYWYCADDSGSGFLHPRGLFTAKGGLIYDRGFEEPNNHDQRDKLTDITPMSRNMLDEKSMSYSSSQQYDDFELVRDVWCSH
ncbi:hypothetical protein [Vibrio nitrifigilis]|uniref:Uncharacterized protein n=1 Tax=Vibrio nitrifigilis TaxID=2789781 RepID=A0ABS0GIC3_9VIBR|nr:hypothetical protein [Vibrio nitrifigilis]MBF9002097.1 hypothetical protein [Vibrio nitrifigilis]